MNTNQPNEGLDVKLADLALELERIGSKNDDKFQLTLIVRPIVADSVRFELSCVETADGHDFVASVSSHLEVAINKARAQIPSACDEWGYKQ